MELNKIRNKSEINYYKNLLKTTKNMKIDINFIKEKLKNLTEDSLTESEINPNPNLNPKIIYSDDYLYKKSWNRISEIHKIIKIKEFVSKLLIENNDDKKSLELKLIKLIKNKKLTKKDKIKYNSIKGRIISIPDLEYYDGKYRIQI